MTPTSTLPEPLQIYTHPAEYRRLFPASAALEMTCSLVHPDGTSHLRNPFTRFGCGGPDAAFCADDYRAPDGSLYDLTKKGLTAVETAECEACQGLVADTLAAAAEEEPAIRREIKKLEADVEALLIVAKAQDAETPETAREEVRVAVAGREATLSVLYALVGERRPERS